MQFSSHSYHDKKGSGVKKKAQPNQAIHIWKENMLCADVVVARFCLEWELTNSLLDFSLLCFLQLLQIEA